ncbi:MAG TPA: hypothetical protein VMN57_15730 [Anaerolineales bacterium]|nr:hypothetical protein [Anaerolineales bacterium]
MNDRPGCLSGFLKLFVLDKVLDFLQARFGFGRGASCTGVGCGLILLIVGIIFACSIMFNTNWFELGF